MQRSKPPSKVALEGAIAASQLVSSKAPSPPLSSKAPSPPLSSTRTSPPENSKAPSPPLSSKTPSPPLSSKAPSPRTSPPKEREILRPLTSKNKPALDPEVPAGREVLLGRSSPSCRPSGTPIHDKWGPSVNPAWDRREIERRQRNAREKLSRSDDKNDEEEEDEKENRYLYWDPFSDLPRPL